jgi:hypothetical protein
VLAHDLETAVESIRASTDSHAESEGRVCALLPFAVSGTYLHLRKGLGISIDG